MMIKRLDGENLLKIYWQPRRNTMRIDHSRKVMGEWQSQGSAELDLGLFCKEERVCPADIASAMSVLMVGMDEPLPNGWNRLKPRTDPLISVQIPIGE